MYFKLQKFTSQNLVNQVAVFCVRNALKVIYEHLRFENFSGVVLPDPFKKGREDMGTERRERKEGSGAPSFQSSAPPVPLG
jgi:hypothetical protein